MSKRTALVTLGSAAVLAAVGGVRSAGADAGDATRVELGRRLFFDPAIGRQGRVACAACHDPEHGFSDARPRSQDESRVLPRHSQPLVDLAGNAFHWDGEFATVREVIDARTLPAAEAIKLDATRTLERVGAVATAGGTPAVDSVNAALSRLRGGGEYGPRPTSAPVEPIAARIADGGRYDEGFRAAFGDAEVTASRVGDALEAYVLSLKSGTAPLDRYVAGDATALDASAQRGLALFRGKAGCAQCHVAEGAHPALADGKFHDTGVETRRVETAKNKGTQADRGRLDASFVETDRGSFKTPSLRDVARRAPYFHDASAKTLEEVVRYYDKGGTAHEHLDPLLHPLDLTDGDVTDLVAFLGSLTSDVRPGLGEATSSRSSKIVVHVERLDGTPAEGVSVSVRPFGDRLAAVEKMPQTRLVTADSRGIVEAEMPASTHVVVGLADEPRTVSQPLPDWTRELRLFVTPNDRASLVVRFRDEDAKPASFFVYPSAREAPVKFEKVRDLGGAEALYATASSTTAGGVSRRSSSGQSCVVCLDAVVGAGAVFAIDLSGGASGTIDLRHAREFVATTAPENQIDEEVRLLSAFTVQQK